MMELPLKRQSIFLFQSFFGRSYNNLGSISECKNGGGCIINKKNRTSCKACRLRKCLMVGMSKSGSRYGRRSNWFKIHCLLQEQANNIENQQIHNHVNGHHGVLHPNHQSLSQHHAAFPYHQTKPISSFSSPTGVPYAHQRHHLSDGASPPPSDTRPHHRANGDGDPTSHHLHPHLLHLHRQRSEEHQQLMMMMMEDYKNRRSSSSPSVVSSPESHNSDSSAEAEKAAHRLHSKEGEASKTPGGDFFLPFLHAGAFHLSSPFGAAAAAAMAAAAAAAAGTPHHKFLFPPIPQPHHQPSLPQHHIRSKSPPCPVNNHLSSMEMYHKRFYLDSVLQSQRSPSGGSASGGSGAEEVASTNSSLLSSSSGNQRRDSRSASPDQEDPMDLSLKGGKLLEEGRRGEEEEGEGDDEMDGEEKAKEDIVEGEEDEEDLEGEEGVNGEANGGSVGEKEEGRTEEERRKEQGHPLDLTTKA
ncbi:hypothetical protein J437_LFUL004236 [Ladona fulva]|uniref:Nuclear receptor domain-containing protein n=1 Tax=Ladona fulva TaxID=123851 RepID=A0A8K0K4Z1_LADFU|nr:hypothetical protein J437_LFUL004236 [Ladona fulva]